jgi:hypothetical protein
MNNEILKAIKPIFGQKCCRARINSFKYLSLGFGKKIFHNNPKLDDEYYGEWEIGSYRSSWRIMRGERVLLGKQDVEENNELNEKLSKIKFGEIVFIKQISKLDIRVELKNNLFVDFLSTFSDIDESFHIFCPDHMFIEMDNKGRWTKGKSNEPYISKK